MMGKVGIDTVWEGISRGEIRNSGMLSQFDRRVLHWYAKKYVQFLIYKGCVNEFGSFREVMIRKHVVKGDGSINRIPFRPLSIRSIDCFKFIFDRLGLFMSGFDMYGTMECFSDIPFSSDLMDLTGAGDMLLERFRDLVVSCDFCLDIDSDSGLDVAKKYAVLIRDFFDSRAIPYGLVFSGNRGFHFRIPWKFLSGCRVCLSAVSKGDVGGLSYFFGSVVRGFCSSIGVPVDGVCKVDLNIYKRRQVLRVPYSVHPKSGLVVLPIKGGELEGFSPDSASVFEVFRRVRLLDRSGLIQGLFINNANSDFSVFDSFFDEFGDFSIFKGGKDDGKVVE